MYRNAIVTLTAIFAAVVLSTTTYASQIDTDAAPRTPTSDVAPFRDGGNIKQDVRGKVVFVCLHGSVKSVVAATYFNRIAKERNLPFVAVARAIDRDKEIPAVIRKSLASDGLIPDEDVPHNLLAYEASEAAAVVAFDPVPVDRRGTAEIIYWANVPLLLKDYRGGRDAIVRHLNEVVKSLPLADKEFNK